MGVVWGGHSPGAHRGGCQRCMARTVLLGYRMHALCLLRRLALLAASYMT